MNVLNLNAPPRRRTGESSRCHTRDMTPACRNASKRTLKVRHILPVLDTTMAWVWWTTVSVLILWTIDMVGADYKNGSLEQYTRSSHTTLPRHRRRTSISMPGSLFSRSPTPDEHPTTRHVRFDSSIISPVPHRQRPMSRRTSQVETMEPQDEKPMEDEGSEIGRAHV